MRTLKLIAALTLGVFVSGCATSDIASRNATLDPSAPKMMLQAEPDQSFAAVAAPSLRISEINVVVPDSLKVSEANRYYPSGDIVWRGDPIGNRHAQIKAIFEAALQQSAQNADGEIPVLLDVEVLRFHALTEKARYSVGGVHSITFRLTVRDPRTGLPMAQPQVVKADLDGFGGQQAIEADRRGETQKVRITAHLAEVFRQEMIKPGGYQNANLGMFQALNKL
ncbi:DUF6778 family protein [Roseobacter sp. GAI101]|uniref:DUF6778 family protein n=1 Tax=Roseobacter sp. (strain GAI101) TaxID=391589 RepID=UPI0001872562|nr:DUF6778 family protein [Roseobacter sp. GAI101]EEB85372.1 lipoprotein, putative [Roseobacter sp. GAI101]